MWKKEGGESLLGGDFRCSGSFVFALFYFCSACRFSSGGARPRCILLSCCLRLGVFCLPLFGLSLLFELFSGYSFTSTFFLIFFIFVLFVSLWFHSSSVVLSLFQCTWVHGVRMLCLSYPVRRWHGFALSTLFYSVPMQYICAVVWWPRTLFLYLH